jgi:hypothetical protein
MRNFLFVLALVFTASSLLAQNNQSPLLSQEDVIRFIDSYDGLSEELKMLGEKYKATDDITIDVEAVNSEAEAIFKKYGWNDNYMGKYSAVFTAFTYVSLETRLEQSPETFRDTMISMLPEFKKSTNDSNIEVVRSHFTELNALIGNPKL